MVNSSWRLFGVKQFKQCVATFNRSQLKSVFANEAAAEVTVLEKKKDA